MNLHFSIYPRIILLGVIVLMGLPILTSCRDRSTDDVNAKLANATLVTAPPTNAPASTYNFNRPTQADSAETNRKLEDIVALEKQGKYDAAVEQATSVIQAEPKNISAYIVRGHIYTEMKAWDKAEADYQTILQIDPDNFSAQFNLSELKLMQKDYDNARPGFVALEKNLDWGDLAAYKVFLCDLFGGHDDAAQSEYNAFDKAGSNASYYYSKATWEFYHKHPDAAQKWIDSAAWIYPPKKVHFYTSTLVDFGYLPAAPQQPTQVP